MTFPCARKLGNICCGHKMFLNKIRKICVRNKCYACGQTGKHLCRQQCVRNKVSSLACTLKKIIRGRPFNPGGGGGGFEGGWFWKKFPARACWKKKTACSTNEIDKKSCTAVSKKEKCCKAISSFLGALQNPSKTATIPDNLQAGEPLWLAY